MRGQSFRTVSARDRFFDLFTLGDCAAAPALFYADQLIPIEQPRTRAYLERLLARPSMIRVWREAEPYWHSFPGAKKSAVETPRL